MKNTELSLDKLLKIKTTGRDDSHSDQFHYPYEPTPYVVLERLANSGYIGKKNKMRRSKDLLIFILRRGKYNGRGIFGTARRTGRSPGADRPSGH